MVDALSRARRWLRDDGVLIDLRPTSDLVAVVSASDAGGWLDAGTLTTEDTRRARYAAADRALRTALDRRWFALDVERTFDFARYSDSADELRDYVAAKWRETRMSAEVHLRAVDLQRARPRSRVRLVERLVIRRLSPVDGVS